MRFRDIVGQQEIKSMLVKGIDEGRISHAQLFSGESGYGVLPLALSYAQYLNCANRKNGDSCGECPSCIKMADLAHPDLHFVYPVNSPKGSGGSQKPTSDNFLPQWRDLWKATGGIFNEQMWYRAINIDNQQGLISRADADGIIRKLSFKSFEAPYKVMIIWLPEKMRTEAANSLLKILEEPWDRTLFLLISEAPGKLLPTILSRTQQIVIPAIDDNDITAYIETKYSTDKEHAAGVARLSGGNLIEAGRLVEQEDDMREYFELFVQLMRFSYNDRHMELLEWAENMASMGREEQKRFLRYGVRLLRDSYMLNAGMTNITYLWGEELTFCEKFSPFIGNHNIEKLVSEMELALAQVTQNGNPKIIFAHFALSVSKLIVK